ncbi:hypothetical protein M1C59_02770 [Gordonia terrae]|uniref:hypothetical protein n=1 Tax=Gordonia terrae TaxID=2055 RepID=UPI00200AA00B|nr:hypothetical protein [Gordonia terrae]UPW09797.1 hypothetical protein M1C59_02770 [Gordonia terrae]
MSDMEVQWFARERCYTYTDYRGHEYSVECKVRGRLEGGHHVPCAAEVKVYDEEQNDHPRVFEIRDAHITKQGHALGHQVTVSDFNLQSVFELMAFAMRALGEMMCDQIQAYWANFPDEMELEQPGCWSLD